MNKDFSRGLSDKFISLLRAEAGKDGWWRDVLADKTLVIGIRRERLNVYWRGQSLFNVSEQGGRLNVTTHEKYLLDPGLNGQVSLVDGVYHVEGLVQRGFLRHYDGSNALKKLKTAAGYYAGVEKRGVHEIVLRNLNVIDVEVAFPGLHGLEDEDDGEKTKDPRVDVATLDADGDDVRLIFWEAKAYKNEELRAASDKARVVRQVRIYEHYLRDNGSAVEESYRTVAGNLAAISDMGWARPLSPLITEVARGSRRLTLGDQPTVGLLIFGFDAAQRDSKTWTGKDGHMSNLKSELTTVLAAGDPKNIRLTRK